MADIIDILKRRKTIILKEPLLAKLGATKSSFRVDTATLEDWKNVARVSNVLGFAVPRMVTNIRLVAIKNGGEYWYFVSLPLEVWPELRDKSREEVVDIMRKKLAESFPGKTIIQITPP